MWQRAHWESGIRLVNLPELVDVLGRVRGLRAGVVGGDHVARVAARRVVQTGKVSTVLAHVTLGAELLHHRVVRPSDGVGDRLGSRRGQAPHLGDRPFGQDRRRVRVLDVDDAPLHFLVLDSGDEAPAAELPRQGVAVHEQGGLDDARMALGTTQRGAPASRLGDPVVRGVQELDDVQGQLIQLLHRRATEGLGAGRRPVEGHVDRDGRGLLGGGLRIPQVAVDAHQGRSALVDLLDLCVASADQTSFGDALDGIDLRRTRGDDRTDEQQEECKQVTRRSTHGSFHHGRVGRPLDEGLMTVRR